MAERNRVTLPVSYAGLLRYDEEVSSITLEPGIAVIGSILFALVIFFMHLLR